MNIKSIMIGAVILAVGMLSGGPAFAASKGVYDVAVKSLFTYEMPKGSMNTTPMGNPKHTTNFRPGDWVGITCGYNFDGTAFEKDYGNWTIGIYVDNHKTTVSGYWMHWHSNTTGTFNTTTTYTIGQTYFNAYALWPRATAGHHIVRCVLNENGEMRETNKANNQRTISIDVRKPVKALIPHKPLIKLGPSKRISTNGNMTMQHGPAPMPNAHIRKCPESVKAVSKIDPQAFFAPFATASKPTKIPDGHLDLYLNSVETFNDTLLCSYATRAGNAKTTVEIACKGAQKTVNGAYCQ
jgi:hypothetical protein